MKIRPLQDRVIVKRIAEEEKTKGGIIIPDTAKEKPQEGEVVAGAGADGDDFAFLRLLLGGIRNDDAALGLLFRSKTADDDTVVQWTKMHVFLFPCFLGPHSGA